MCPSVNGSRHMSLFIPTRPPETRKKSQNFCQWIENVKQRETWLCTYNRRIVPLTHHAFVTYPDSYFDKLPLNIKSIIEEEKMHNNPVVIKMENQPFKEKRYQKILKVHQKTIC